MFSHLRCAAFLLLGLVCWPALAAKVNTSTLQVDVRGTTIPVYLYKPEGRGPFPLIVLSHGSPRELKDRGSLGPTTLHDQARAFVTDGAAVAVPIRRGYGGNGAPKDLYRLDCGHPDFYDSARAGIEDIAEVIQAAAKDPEIDTTRVVLVGHSAGGFASVAAATHEKVMGVVGFAPGRGSLAPDKVACKPQLVKAMMRFGKADTVPELWIYSSNDHFFGPVLARELYDAFNHAGGHATFIQAPEYGTEGHAYIEDISSWQPEVDAFLRKIGFLTK